MWDISRIKHRWIYLVLAGSAILASWAHAAPYEEKMLALPPAKEAAEQKNYDQFTRVIMWFPDLYPCCAFSIYISHETIKLPERGFISFKMQKIDGTFWERSRPLSEKEARTISTLFEQEEIFSLSATPWSDQKYPLIKGRVSGSGVYYFVHIDKVRHKRKEVRRVAAYCKPAQRVGAGLGEIIKDYLDEYDKDPKSPGASWRAEGKANTHQ
jgi:hypothetical protein